VCARSPRIAQCNNPAGYPEGGTIAGELNLVSSDELVGNVVEVAADDLRLRPDA
jgi:hypothetical protein